MKLGFFGVFFAYKYIISPVLSNMHNNYIGGLYNVSKLWLSE